MTALSEERATLAAATEQVHSAVLTALDDPNADSLAAVSLCSAHLAAADRVLYPAACRELADRRQVRELRRTDHRLQQALFRLDRRLTGDVNLAYRPVESLEAEVRSRLEEHIDAEHRVLDSLEQALDADRQCELVEQLGEAMSQAPTRPHPHIPHPPLGSGLMFRLEATVDHLRDLMDNRDVRDLHRVRPPRPAGRWGYYFMGLPYPGWPAPEARREATAAPTRDE